MDFESRPNAIPASKSTFAPVRKNAKIKKPSRKRGTTVFVVHGRDLEARDAMFTFLRAIGLKPLEWSQAIRLTRQASPYVGTILEKAFEQAAAIVVLLTPDDEARLKRKFQKPKEPDHEKKPDRPSSSGSCWEQLLMAAPNPWRHAEFLRGLLKIRIWKYDSAL
ncbi:MAG TPA: TIR domain-containing protein [Candidatus Udaeobacter sp.]|nr:TIR domain-containing protein [Candidatus Udaeobacter sp.]